jgi:hypothetical protein
MIKHLRRMSRGKNKGRTSRARVHHVLRQMHRERYARYVRYGRYARLW